MLTLFISVLLFGLVHPLSKSILDSGIPLSYFCVFYVGIRLVAQAPWMIATIPQKKSSMKAHWPQLILLGLCGAALQYFEFKGIEEGLSPGLVTFLMFSYPIWILVSRKFSGHEALLSVASLRVVSGLLGIVLVSMHSFNGIDFTSITLLYPLAASLFIALWISLSNQLRKKDMPTLKLSFFYDLFSVVALLLVLSQNLEQEQTAFLLWASNSSHLLMITGYSLFVGLLPNLLFYKASSTVSPLIAAMALALEPILSTFYSGLLWGHSWGPGFVLGAMFILLANLPENSAQVLVVLGKLPKKIETGPLHCALRPSGSRISSLRQGQPLDILREI